MNGNENEGGNGTDRRGPPAARQRDAMAVVRWTGWAAVVVILGWIDPALVVLLGLVIGIAWLCRTDADPVHWGPVPRRRRDARASTAVRSESGAQPFRPAARDHAGSPAGPDRSRSAPTSAVVTLSRSGSSRRRS